MRLLTSLALRYLIVAALAVGITSVAVKVTAQSTGAGNQTPQTTLDQRLTERQKAHKSDLNGLSKSRITTHCIAAQSKLSSLKTKKEASLEKRQSVYKGLSEKLANIIKNLQKQQINTKELASVQTKYNEATTRYQGSYQKYKIALDDSMTIDCTQDPNGFFVSLLDSRKMLTQLASESAAIKTVLPQLSTSLSSAKLALINGPEAQQ